ncbi:membrane associated zinc metalloprotease [Legionella geestiana]|uniref:Zinc metalloprotease n=1 Tax=Legionella geestiana TaxID=45065 RepID=A0A0W0TTN8_9GAMM|nr:RIP metalloprotease RseP [Legionella geestiana]KTC98779.1 membrane associated zinc metalloprotease [Legionella geestiana]QBS12786.1 RIP metalloprotease RseP [Legionella geestiana]STX54738.1 membrane associated zinc metalloprotease [Legionella geestiana]
MLTTLMSFLLALFVLVIVHEAGHYLVARACGVRVLRFSFGFGPVLARFRNRHHTEFAWSAFPLGGYVKMLDTTEAEVAPSERSEAFDCQPVWSRIAIVAAGPVFNLLFAFFALWLALIIGFKTLAPIVGEVRPQSIADDMGLRASQEIVRLGDIPVASWRDFQYALLPFLGSKVAVPVVVRDMKSGREIPLKLPMERLQLDSGRVSLFESLGILPFMPKLKPVVGEVVDGSPAAKAGFLPGDRVVSVNAEPVGDWVDFVTLVRARPDTDVNVQVKRDGGLLNLNVSIGSQESAGRREGYLGLLSLKPDWPKGWYRVQRETPLQAIPEAFSQTLHLTGATFISIGRFLTGQLALKNLSGPVGIAEGAGESARSGFVWYLSFLALVSISLGVLNLLPVPLLDGGHLFYYLMEVVFRRPVPEGVKTAGAYVGLAVLMALMVIALTNDVARLGSVLIS